MSPETLFQTACREQAAELLRMTSRELQACTKKVLADMARNYGIAGWHKMRKEELIGALLKLARRDKARVARPRPQLAAARNTSGNGSPEEQVERAKYDVGVPTKDLSANPPRSYRIDIGYLARSGRFYILARSNVVTTPRAGVSDVIDENWADLDSKKADRIYAMSGGFDPGASSLELKRLFEEKLRRPLGSPAVTSFGS